MNKWERQYIRVPLSVECSFSEKGTLLPKRIIFDGEKYEIDRILRRKRYAPNVSCIAPIEYTVSVEGYEKKIYFEEDTNMWFSVRKK